MMQIQLPGKAAEIVNEQGASGFYGSANEFVSDVILRTDEFNWLKLERLRREVIIGLEEIKRGEVVEFDLEDILNADVN
jgi:Arc/MetJ-type ribon-helix-helix transcriptional regulator